MNSLRRLTTNIVPPVGPRDAKICLIGQAPEEEEDIALEPFVGNAGQFQNRVMRQVGILRSEVLINNVFCQRPPENRVEHFFEDKSKTKLTLEAREHVEVLRNWLEGLDPRPNVLVALGREAMMILTGKKRIWKWRGSILPCTLVEGFKVYPTLHPSGVLRLLNEPREKLQGARKEFANNAFPLFLRDWERIKIQAEFPEIRRTHRNIEIDLSYDQLLERLDWINSESLDCAVDIETLYGPEGPIVWMVGFAPSPEHAFVVYFIRGGRFAWPLQREAQLWDSISQYFLNPKAKKIFQYGNYDMSILGRYYGIRVANGTYQDTMWCHHASFPQLKKSLETLASIYTWEPYYKDEGKVNYGKRTGDQAEGIYNGKDVCVTREILPVTREHAEIMGTWNGYCRSMSYMPSLFSMMIRGVKIDVEKKKALGIEYARRAEQAQNYANELEGEYINLNSSKKVIQLLYYKHLFKEQRKRTRNAKGERPLTADKDALNKLKRLYPKEEIIQCILDFRKFSKLHGTYTEMQLESDGRVRTAYGFVSTWRLSSSESHFGAGGNLQNIPVRTEEGREIRRLFIPDNMEPYGNDEWPIVVELVRKVCGAKIADGLVNGIKLMLAADLSQAEARVVAWEAEDVKRIQNFNAGVDVHWENAKDIFDMPISMPYNKEEVFIDPYTNEEHTLKEFRDIGKTVKHARNYGMGPYEMMAILARQGFILTFSQCKALLEAAARKSPELESWQRNIRETVKAQRFLISSFGRKRYFYGRLDENTNRAAYAFSPQNTVGEIVEQGIQEIEDKGTWIENLLNVHDEVVTQIEPHTIIESIKLIRSAMECELTIHQRPLVIPVDFKAGQNWGDLVEFEPLLGDKNEDRI